MKSFIIWLFLLKTKTKLSQFWETQFRLGIYEKVYREWLGKFKFALLAKNKMLKNCIKDCFVAAVAIMFGFTGNGHSWAVPKKFSLLGLSYSWKWARMRIIWRLTTRIENDHPSMRPGPATLNAVLPNQEWQTCPFPKRETFDVSGKSSLMAI